MEFNNVVSLTGLGDYLDSMIRGFYGASRLLLLPAITGINKVNCELLNSFCCSDGLLTVNYRVIGRVSIVRAVLGSIVRNEVPCMIDVRRMPPLSRFVEGGFASIKGNSLIINYWGDYMKILESSEEASIILELLSALRRCGAYTVNSLSRCMGVDEDDVLRALIILRMLYPALIEVVLPNGSTMNSKLGEFGIGKLLSVDELFNALVVNDSGNAVVVPSPLLKVLSHISPRTRPRSRIREQSKLVVNGDIVVVRSGSSKYSIPSILTSLISIMPLSRILAVGLALRGLMGLGVVHPS
ncbi:hypothetical protein [Vulcanisaeta sp. JCM 16159]|uniref:hypothetical protein n=1 Tax=Vulcanisaeta sp. JCM 16159 TaxID=1295371 RepID=UPI001FB3FBD7|nr:hypothetical protein [Vulcanisaeta sp. JCM 16159]